MLRPQFPHYLEIRVIYKCSKKQQCKVAKIKNERSRFCWQLLAIYHQLKTQKAWLLYYH